MPYLRSEDVVKPHRSNKRFNISDEVYDNFRIACARLEIPVNVVVEIFMQQYLDGDITMPETHDPNKRSRNIAVDVTLADQYRVIKGFSELLTTFMIGFVEGVYVLVLGTEVREIGRYAEIKKTEHPEE